MLPKVKKRNEEVQSILQTLYDSTEREASEIPEESMDDNEPDMPKNDGNVQLISRALNSKMSILKHENIEV